jgi:hypothetical protein
MLMKQRKNFAASANSGKKLKPGGRFLFHDVFRSSAESPFYPTPWAEDEPMSALATETEARAMPY